MWHLHQPTRKRRRNQGTHIQVLECMRPPYHGVWTRPCSWSQADACVGALGGSQLEVMTVNTIESLQSSTCPDCSCNTCAAQQHNNGTCHTQLPAGTMEHGVRHGRGKYTFGASGAAFEGQYVNGQKQGHGIMKFPDGSKYEGEGGLSP